jgi:hypothetical protein
MARQQAFKTTFDRSTVPTITCVNNAKLDLGVDFDRLVDTLQTFLHECFVPVWGTPAKLTKASKEKAGTWTMLFLDDPDDPDENDAYGEHYLTSHGFPISRVYVIPTIKSGELVSVTACHELCEMLIDPMANLWCDGPRGAHWGYEVCDPCEEETFPVDGIEMSDFVYPAYFDLFRLEHPRLARAQYDHLDKIKRPFQILEGGYAEIKIGTKVVERFGSPAKKRRFAKEDRRYHRSEFRKFGKKAARRRKAFHRPA